MRGALFICIHHKRRENPEFIVTKNSHSCLWTTNKILVKLFSLMQKRAQTLTNHKICENHKTVKKGNLRRLDMSQNSSTSMA